ncbi:MAG: hypothetical protein E7293_04255 [Lachnospiraceae bacterium]|nr:hypothetical protein [Lachnospiraceae bacterium]
MKKKSKIIAIISVIIVLLLSTAIIHLLQHKDSKDVILSLSSFQSDNEYQYDNIKWQSSVQEVQKNLPYSLERDTYRESGSDTIAYYKAKNKHILDGQSGAASFEFVKDQLKIVQLSFHLDDDADQWFEKQVTKLQELYGTEYVKSENSSEQLHLKSIGYRWDKNNTSLQFVMLSGDNRNPSAIFSVGVK